MGILYLIFFLVPQEAEHYKFNADDVQAALVQCGDKDAIDWLRANWESLTANVQTLATKYGHECPENKVGTVSALEAKEALRNHKGNLWAAVTDCVEQRQKKVTILNGYFDGSGIKIRFYSL